MLGLHDRLEYRAASPDDSSTDTRGRGQPLPNGNPPIPKPELGKLLKYRRHETRHFSDPGGWILTRNLNPPVYLFV